MAGPELFILTEFHCTLCFTEVGKLDLGKFHNAFRFKPTFETAPAASKIDARYKMEKNDSKVTISLP